MCKNWCNRGSYWVQVDILGASRTKQCQPKTQRPGNCICPASRHLLGDIHYGSGVSWLLNSRYTAAWGLPGYLGLTLGGGMTFRYLLHQKQQAREECEDRKPTIKSQPCSVPKPAGSSGAFLSPLLFSLVLNPEEAGRTIPHCPVHSSTFRHKHKP